MRPKRLSTCPKRSSLSAKANLILETLSYHNDFVKGVSVENEGNAWRGSLDLGLHTGSRGNTEVLLAIDPSEYSKGAY